MANEALANLAHIGQLKSEAQNPAELQRMLEKAKTRWADAQIMAASVDGRHLVGACWMQPIKSATWPSTKVI